MQFDERLHRAFETLAERLHQEFSAQLNATRVDLAGSLQEAWQAALEQAVQEARTDAERESLARLTAETARADADARAETMATHRQHDERLLDAVRRMDIAHSLSDILDVLVAGAAAEAGRAAVFLPQGSTLRGWKLVGFESLDHEEPSIDLPFVDGGIVAEAAETGRLIRVDPGASRTALLPAFVELSDRSRALALPLVMTGQVFAVLYADEGVNEPAGVEAWPVLVEVLARHAARTLEAITATRLAQAAEVEAV